MASPFVGQIIMFAGTFAPKGWHLCDGSLLNVSQNTALFSLLGTTYGGNGQTTFALPDLRSRVAVGAGQGTGLSSWQAGQQGGTENVTLNTSQIPTHNHTLVASNVPGADVSPTNDYLAQPIDSQQGNVQAYANSLTAANMAGGSIGNTGGGQSHTNIQPSMGMNYCIALQGIYPQRN